jgi:hypothetical protein
LTQSTGTGSGDAFASALVEETAKKTDVCWLAYDGVQHAAWHLWLDGSLCLVSGGDEQPLPDIERQDTVEVTLRSKDNGGRLVTWVGRVSVVRPDDPAWEPVTTALLSERLNLPDLTTAVAHWAATSTVTRVAPTGELREGPGSLSEDAHLAVPRSTPATTAGPLPRVLHRRVLRRPKLS